MWAPDPAALPAWPLHRAVVRAFVRVALVDRLGHAQRSTWQRRRLRQLFGNAALGSWEQRAPLEREQLRRHVESQAAPPRAAVEVITSGSSGTPLRLCLPLDEYAAGLAAVSYGFLVSGVRPGSRIAHLCVPIGDGSRVQRLGPWQVRRIDLRLPEPEVLRALSSFRPHTIYAYPSHLEVLLRDADAGSVPPPRLVITNGEPLTDSLRLRLVSLWGCDLLDTYGSVELPRVAFACKAGTLHSLDGAVLIETDPLTRDEEGFEDLLLTSLYHRRVPIARYRIGDRARVDRDHRCVCGRRGLAIAQLQGRRDDLLRLPSGRAVSPRAVSLLEHDPRVREYQLVQTGLERLTLQIVAHERLSHHDHSELTALVRRGLGGEDVAIEVRQVEGLPRTASGKRRAVVSLLG